MEIPIFLGLFYVKQIRHLIFLALILYLITGPGESAMWHKRQDKAF